MVSSSRDEVGETIERGVRAHQAGRLEEALTCYRAALAVAPNDAEALSLCGLAMVHLGQAEQALPLLTRAVEIEPAQAGFRRNLVQGLEKASEALIARRDWTALQSVAGVWVQTDHLSDRAWRMLARSAFEQGMHIAAANQFAAMMRLTPRSAADLNTYASLCLHALDFDAATKALDESEPLDPDNVDMLSNRALLLMYLGRFDEAEAYCRRCLARDPEHVPAYTTLSRIRRGHLADADAAATARIARRSDSHLDRRIPAAFAAAHASDAPDAAFAAYEYAHSLALERDALEGRRYDPAKTESRTDRIIRLSATLPAFAPPAASLRPIFIVGMPRSGTTLIESVLAAHSRVFACGERPHMQHLLRTWLALDEAGKVPTVQELPGWVGAYWVGLKNVGVADHVTDKHPLNFEAVGLIARLFPEATIVNVRRNPLESCLSIYCQEFNKHWTFAHQLADIGHYYGHYARLAAHWERTLPDRFVTIQYEDFVQDFPQAAPRLLQACGLSWEPQCLQFQGKQRAIATFSTVQARGPVALGTSRAARYEKHLASLQAALERARVDPVTGQLQR